MFYDQQVPEYLCNLCRSLKKIIILIAVRVRVYEVFVLRVKCLYV